MAKKNDKAAKAAKRQRGLEKSLKNSKKGESKSQKQNAKLGAEDEDNVDIDEVLAELAKQQADHDKVTIDICKRPSKRQNGTLVPNPANRKEILLFGGEVLTKEGTAQFYNDLFVYNTHTDVWRSVKSANSPLPRSSHAMCAHPSGVVIMHGGEFSSPKQTSFHHYGDTWVLDGESKEWTKIEGRGKILTPQPRSGHRMCAWKNYIILHGGFKDLSVSTSYLDDLWAFDVSDYKWHKIEIPPTLAIPDARSGHSLLPTAEGALLHGGYTKIKASKGQQKGKVLQDSWLLHMKPDLKDIKWERRKKGAFAPSPRTGCQLVPHRIGTGRGIMFGGVYDTEETEESLKSIFYDSIYSYQAETNRWTSLRIRAGRRKPELPHAKQSASRANNGELEQNLSQVLQRLNIDLNEMVATGDNDDDDEIEGEEEQASANQYSVMNSLPHPRFNATVCVSGDTLFVYCGTWEDGDREFSFDSFYSVDLGKLDGVKVFWEDLGLTEKDDDEMSDEDEDDEDDSEIDDDTEMLDEPPVEAEDFEADEEAEDEDESAKDPRPWLPHPKPFETVRTFYITHVNTFVEWALKQEPDARGKALRTNAFELCRSRWWERRESVQGVEDQLEDMGGVEDVVERSTARTSRR